MRELLKHPKCEELMMVVNEYNHDQQAFYDTIYPPKVEEIPLDDSNEGKGAQVGKNKEDATRENRAVLSEKYAGFIIPTLTVCSLITGAVLGKHYAHKRHTQAEERKKKGALLLKSTEKSSSSAEKSSELESTVWSPRKKLLVGSLSLCTALMGYLFYKGKSSTNVVAKK